MLKRLIFILLIMSLLPTALFAQEADLTEEDLPEIDYYRSPLGFNIPVLGGWENFSTNEAANFTNEAANAEILVTLTNESVVETGIDQILVEGFDTDVSVEPVFSSKINLADGTWTQVIYQNDERTISAMGQIRNDKTYVLSMVEDQVDADVFLMVVPTPDDASSTEDVLPGMLLAAEEIGITIDSDPESIETISLPSGNWTKAIYDLDGDTVTLMGFVFGNATYVTVATGDVVGIEDITNKFNTAFLGFFVTPENNEFLYLGLVATGGIMLILVGSFWLRHRNAQKDIELIEQLQAE